MGTNIVIDYVKSLPNNDLTFKSLVSKLVTLLALVSGQRVSTLHEFRLDEMHVRDKEVTFYVSALLKHDKPKNTKDPFTFHAYPHNSQLCPVTLLKHYIAVRATLVSSTEMALFITHGKPHHGASKDTLARWIKDTLLLSGVDTNVFQAHSCRSASTSAAASAGVPIQTILRAGQWSMGTNFYKFYQKDIIWTDIKENEEFSLRLLSRSDMHH